ncbi:hypothetical protein JRQ81_006661 [Phrynocephalus forsythii]|uniref:START domain-containing protein n=1 Tax=Phrynocephalus forsythii TaxID=171643 RepID=A0A9Q0XDE6_9SAUR|nr:hypothetical protein JRQ81_006661 [Phrynocephalus forsythii]
MMAEGAGWGLGIPVATTGPGLARLRSRWRRKSPKRTATRWDEPVNHVYKAEGIIPAKLEDVYKCIVPEDGGLREQWDENVKELEVVDRIGDNVLIVRTATPSVFMKIISPRDFLDVVLIQRMEDGTIAVTATNTKHPLCPPQPNFVRALNYPCGCVCVPVPRPKVDVGYSVSASVAAQSVTSRSTRGTRMGCVLPKCNL